MEDVSLGRMGADGGGRKELTGEAVEGAEDTKSNPAGRCHGDMILFL